jgi:hypothetical protein
VQRTLSIPSHLSALIDIASAIFALNERGIFFILHFTLEKYDGEEERREE